jgi:hypothetical protein
MSKQFKEQGGAATMDPSALLRWLTSMVISRVVSINRLEKKTDKSGESSTSQQSASRCRLLPPGG